MLESRQDLVLMREPDRFVRDLVTTLGADPAPWLAVLDTLLRPHDDQVDQVPDGGETGAAPRGRHWLTRKVAIVAGVGMLVVGAVAAWSVAPTDPPAAAAIDFDHPAMIESGDSGLSLTVDRDANEPGAHVVLALGADKAMTGWNLVAPYRANPDYRQLRPSGKLLMCLEVFEASFADRAAVQQAGCNGEQNQYWKALPGPSGSVRFANLNSGQCLSVASAHPQAGMRVVQRECDDRQQAQQWRVNATNYPTPATSIAPGQVGPDPAVLCQLI